MKGVLVFLIVTAIKYRSFSNGEQRTQITLSNSDETFLSKMKPGDAQAQFRQKLMEKARQKIKLEDEKAQQKIQLEGEKAQLEGEKAQLEGEKAQLKIELEEENRKSFFHKVSCAFTNFKSASEDCWNKFQLPRVQIWHNGNANHSKLEWPIDMLLLIEEADNFVIREKCNGERLSKINQAFKKWYTFARHPERITKNPVQNWFSTQLNAKLVDYFNKHRNEAENVENPHFHDLESFFKYFAAIMVRAYRIGCVYSHNVCAIFLNWEYPDEDFLDIFHRVLPRWDFKKSDMDVYNIAWKVSRMGKMELGKPAYDAKDILEVGYHLENRFPTCKDIIIPVSSNCPKAKANLSPLTTFASLILPPD